jgi:hypothetical protein
MASMLRQIEDDFNCFCMQMEDDPNIFFDRNTTSISFVNERLPQLIIN